MQAFFINIVPTVVFIIILVFCYILSKAKKVPPNTTIIIDRDSHFHKKKRGGYYLLNSKKDRVTTQVSSNPIREKYINIFKTHDDLYYNVSFTMTYVCKEPESTLDALADSKRSIYDIANCAVETIFGTYEQRSLVKTTLEEMNDQLFKQLEATLEYFYIDVTEAHIINYSIINEEVGRNAIFQKHISSSNEPIQ